MHTGFVTAAAVAAALCAEAATWQFVARAGDIAATDGGSLLSWSGTWQSELAPLHGGADGWTSPVVGGKSVVFASSATPLSPPVSCTSLVSRVFLVATATNLAPRATLAFASTSFWLSEPSMGRIALCPAMQTSCAAPPVVDGAVGSEIVAGRRFLAEIALEPALPACDVFVGGHPATSLWRRGWQGSVHEVVMLGADASEADAQAVRFLLSRYWRTPGATPRPSGARSILHSLGVGTHGLFGTTIETR